MGFYFDKQGHAKVDQLRHEFSKNEVGKKFLTTLYWYGFLDRLLPKTKIDPLEIFSGHRPEGFDIHHIVPLSGGGSNKLSNLCLIDKKLHTFLNNNCFDETLKLSDTSQPVWMDFPTFPPVLTYEDFLPFAAYTLSLRGKLKGSASSSFVQFLKTPEEREKFDELVADKNKVFASGVDKEITQRWRTICVNLGEFEQPPASYKKEKETKPKIDFSKIKSKNPKKNRKPEKPNKVSSHLKNSVHEQNGQHVR